jgi:hypothetical protein
MPVDLREDLARAAAAQDISAKMIANGNFNASF